jgi:hypothetical protein
MMSIKPETDKFPAQVIEAEGAIGPPGKIVQGSSRLATYFIGICARPTNMAYRYRAVSPPHLLDAEVPFVH